MVTKGRYYLGYGFPPSWIRSALKLTPWRRIGCVAAWGGRMKLSNSFARGCAPIPKATKSFSNWAVSPMRTAKISKRPEIFGSWLCDDGKNRKEGKVNPTPFCTKKLLAIWLSWKSGLGIG